MEYRNQEEAMIAAAMEGVNITNQRAGQWLFNHLPPPVANVVAGSTFDPFYNIETMAGVGQWIRNHLIFDGQEIVAVFDKNNILWEKPKANTEKEI